MMLLVDTSVWSLALRRDVVAAQTEVLYLEQALLGPCGDRHLIFF